MWSLWAAKTSLEDPLSVVPKSGDHGDKYRPTHGIDGESRTPYLSKSQTRRIGYRTSKCKRYRKSW